MPEFYQLQTLQMFLAQWNFNIGSLYQLQVRDLRSATKPASQIWLQYAVGISTWSIHLVCIDLRDKSVPLCKATFVRL